MSVSEQAKTFLYATMKGFCLSVKASLLLAQTALISSCTGACIDLCGVEIEQDSKVRHSSLRRQQRELLHEFYTHPTRIALVGNAGIEAAVGDDKLSFVQSRDNYSSEMLCPISLEQQSLSQRGDRQFGTMQQKLAY